MPKKKEFLNDLSRLGFPMMEVEPFFDVNKTLAEAVKSSDPRLWEAFPVLLANAVKEAGWDENKLKGVLKTPQQQKRMKNLFLLSLAVWRFYHVTFSWMSQYVQNLSDEDKRQVKNLESSLGMNNELDSGGLKLSTDRLKNVFRNYFEHRVQDVKEFQSRDEELALEFALSQVFSPRQKELFWKKLHHESLTKTEREYFSRAVKKKVLALANPQLHRLAQRLLEY